MNWLRGHGLQSNEIAMPDDSPASSSSSSATATTKSLGTPMVKPDEMIVATLVSMGFEEVASNFTRFYSFLT